MDRVVREKVVIEPDARTWQLLMPGSCSNIGGMCAALKNFVPQTSGAQTEKEKL